VTDETARDALKALHDDDAVDPVPPMLQMDGIRIATLAVLGCLVVSSLLQGVYLVTTVRDQRLVNECYQEQVDALTSWANTAADAAKSDRQAQRELLLGQLGGTDPRTAVGRYLAQLDEADRTRTTAPVPAQRCTR
jgi:hypothetical protein